MSLNFPFMGFPKFRPRPNSFYKDHFHNNNIESNAHTKHIVNHSGEHCSSVNQSFLLHNKNETHKANSVSEDKDFLDIFGIRLYYDDILLLSLIFFLYNEGVDDNGLFIALILLLLS